MEEAIQAIIERIREGKAIDSRWIESLLRSKNRKNHDKTRRIAKKRLLPFYLKERNQHSERWQSWHVTDEIDAAFVALLRAKPRRSASGVATVTVLTRPWPCSSDCIYCPNDIRMPKSYLSDEPACQRAERCWFDPYLQVIARLSVLADMGHNIDKVELIVLGGTFSEYPEAYRIWFMKELFCALNDFKQDDVLERVEKRREFYRASGMKDDPQELLQERAEAQRRINVSRTSYNEEISAINRAYPASIVAQEQSASLDDLYAEQARNETAACRNVGLVVETRPDLITADHLTHLRALGCTKIQMGIQSLDDDILAANARGASVEAIERACNLLRTYGFKSHIHFMVNLVGATPARDKSGYEQLVSDKRFKPDEIKLYPCALVESAHLMSAYEQGAWRPYCEEELLDVLTYALAITPPCTRISRMIRDISSKDIVVGNKKANLRQMVESAVSDVEVSEMRLREVGTGEIDLHELSLNDVSYETSNTCEHFLQWTTKDNKLAAFLRLSLPKDSHEYAMIREVHVYGRVSRLHEQKEGAQHAGLGRMLVERACDMAKDAHYAKIKVISAIGTKNYYRNLAFYDDGLYLTRDLELKQAGA